MTPLRFLLPLVLAALPVLASPPVSAQPVAAGFTSAAQADFHNPFTELREAHATAEAGSARAVAAGRLGAVLLGAHRPIEAKPFLKEAYAAAPNRQRALAALDLGDMAALEERPAEAEQYFADAVGLAPNDPDVQVVGELKRLRLPGAQHRPERLIALLNTLQAVSNHAERDRYALDLGAQAMALQPPLESTAHAAFTVASLSARPGLAAAGYDGLSQVHELQGRWQESLRLAEAGVSRGRALTSSEVLVSLEWRQARLWQKLGNQDAAIAALRNAVDHIEAIRSAIPVTYDNGRSSHRDTLEPIYHNLVDLLLRKSAGASDTERTRLLRLARVAIDRYMQSELEDYLGSRCSVGTRRLQAGDPVIPPATAVLYPLMLPGRIELLLETRAGISQQTVSADVGAFRDTAFAFASEIRNTYGSEKTIQALGQALYLKLLAPLASQLDQQGIHTVQVAADGILRLVPMGALHDGEGYLVQRYAFSNALGFAASGDGRRRADNRAFIAGMSRPGPVVEKMTPELMGAIAEPDQRGFLPNTRAPFALAMAPDPATASRAARLEKIRDSLALPGVRAEVEQLSGITAAPALLDAQFTVARLRQALTQHDHQVVHLATHGVFGSSAATTFIMAYDDLVTLGDLQQVLRERQVKRQPLDLLTLSACQTAQGDDRAPLGLSGAAILAGSKSALGSLWPVRDDAAALLMGKFYQRLPQSGKARALQAAQLDLLAEADYQHPFNWAPFIIAGESQ